MESLRGTLHSRQGIPYRRTPPRADSFGGIRSTVPGQRQLALRALAGVLRGRAACIGRGEAPPHPRLPEMVPVAIR